MVYPRNSVTGLAAALVAIGFSAGCQRQRDQSGESRAQRALPGTNPESTGFVPDCNRGIKGLTCYLDTTYEQSFPGEAISATMKTWLLFGARGDSIELFSGAGSAMMTSLGQEHDVRNNTASYFRRRLANSGAISVLVTTSDGRGDSVEYYLRLREQGSDRSPLRVTGERAQLTIEGRGPSGRASVVPLAVVSSLTDLSAWEIDAATYNVALVRDSLYQVCRVPCRKPDTLRLAPGLHPIWLGRGLSSRHSQGR
jgi:hypothetical protein